MPIPQLQMSPAEGSAVRRIFGSLGLVMGGKAGAGLISVLYLMIAAPALGPREFGVLVLMHGYVTLVVGIIAFPTWQAIIRYGAEAKHEDAPHRMARLLRFSTAIELSVGVLALLVAAVLAPFAGPVFGWGDSAGATALAVPYCIAALGSVRATPTGYLQLEGRFDLIGLHNMVAPTVRLAGAGIVALAGFGLTGFLICWMIAAVAEWAVIWVMGLRVAAARLGPTLNRPEPGAVTEDNALIWRFLIASNVDVTLRELAGRAAPLIVGWVMGPVAAGLFSVAQRATVVIAQPALMLGNTAYTELARLVAVGEGGRPLRVALYKVSGLSLLASLPVVGILWIFSAEIVRLLAGEAFLGAEALMVWLMVAKAVSLVTPICSSALTALGRPGLSLTTNLIFSIVFLAALPLLLQQFGLIGAGLQALGQSLLVSGVLAVLTVHLSRKTGS